MLIYRNLLNIKKKEVVRGNETITQKIMLRNVNIKII